MKKYKNIKGGKGLKTREGQGKKREGNRYRFE